MREWNHPPEQGHECTGNPAYQPGSHTKFQTYVGLLPFCRFTHTLRLRTLIEREQRAPGREASRTFAVRPRIRRVEYELRCHVAKADEQRGHQQSLVVP